MWVVFFFNFTLFFVTAVWFLTYTFCFMGQFSEIPVIQSNTDLGVVGYFVDKRGINPLVGIPVIRTLLPLQESQGSIPGRGTKRS